MVEVENSFHYAIPPLSLFITKIVVLKARVKQHVQLEIEGIKNSCCNRNKDKLFILSLVTVNINGIAIVRTLQH